MSLLRRCGRHTHLFLWQKCPCGVDRLNQPPPPPPPPTRLVTHWSACVVNDYGVGVTVSWCWEVRVISSLRRCCDWLGFIACYMPINPWSSLVANQLIFGDCRADRTQIMWRLLSVFIKGEASLTSHSTEPLWGTTHVRTQQTTSATCSTWVTSSLSMGGNLSLTSWWWEQTDWPTALEKCVWGRPGLWGGLQGWIHSCGRETAFLEDLRGEGELQIESWEAQRNHYPCELILTEPFFACLIMSSTALKKSTSSKDRFSEWRIGMNFPWSLWVTRLTWNSRGRWVWLSSSPSYTPDSLQRSHAPTDHGSLDYQQLTNWLCEAAGLKYFKVSQSREVQSVKQALSQSSKQSALSSYWNSGGWEYFIQNMH